MTLFSGLAGFAARGSQYFDEAREQAEKIIDLKMRDSITRGRARWDAHKAEKKLTRKLAKGLSAYGLSVDQIGVALEQGRGEEVLAHMQKYEGFTEEQKKKLFPQGYSPQTIINMGEGYEESGMTMDEMLNSVSGKIVGGMSISDAISDSTGQEKGNIFSKFFSPNTNKIARKQMEAYEAVYGKGALNTLGSYASGSVTSKDLPFSGKVNLTSAVTVKEEMDKLDTTGIVAPNENAFRNSVLKDAATYIGADPDAVADGLISISPEAKERHGDKVAGYFTREINKLLIKEQGKMKKGQRFGPTQRETIANEFDRIMSDYKEFKKQLEVDNPTTKINTLESTARTKELPPEDQAKWLEDYAQLLQKTQGLNSQVAFERAQEAFEKFSKERQVKNKQKNKEPTGGFMKRVYERKEKFEKKNKKD